MKTYIIAEAGVNHNGSIEIAKQMIKVAAKTGVDSIKFQTFKSEQVVSRHAMKAEYQVANTGKAQESQLEMIKKLELDLNAHRELLRCCQDEGIQFLSTPFDLASIDLLVKELRVPKLKIPSGEITNAPFLLKVAQSGLPLIMSTGMSTLKEIEEALGVLAFGMLSKLTNPSREGFDNAFKSFEGKFYLNERVSLLHCTTEYPAPFNEINLKAMDTMRKRFGLPVGYSDHTVGITIPIAAVARGATIIEKHFTLDRNMPGPDHKASLEPQELNSMVKAIREVEVSLGNGVKEPAPSEIKNKEIARKSLIAMVPIQKGEKFTSINLGVKRPGNGVSPFEYWDYLNREADQNFDEDEVIK